MADGDGIVYLAIVLSLLAIVVSYLHIISHDQRLVGVARMVVLSQLVLVSGMMLYLYYLFMSSDMTNFYVWQYSTVDLARKYKFSAVLAGLAGSLLFWIWWIIIPWTVEEWRATRRKVDPVMLSWARIWTFVAMTVLLVTLTYYDTFAPTPGDLLASTPDGNGLNPLLQTDLMVIHPPVVFIAYGVMVLPFAAGLAYLQTRRKEWTDLALDWSRVGWFFLTAGIGIGALWAYIVLGWGGYWAWDPIETSSLLPWLLLTGFLHAQLMFIRKGEYKLTAPLLGVVSFILVVFATFATRAAGLWVSVHAYGQADTSVSPWDRFKDIMSESPATRIYVIFMIVMALVTLFMAYRVYSGDKGRARKEEDQYIELQELISDKFLMFATISLLGLTTVVTFIILVSGVNGSGPEDFDGPIGILAMAGVLLLLVCLVWRDLGRKRVLQLAAAGLVGSIIGALMFPDNIAVSGTVPIILVALAGTGFKVVRTFDPKRPLPSMRLVSAHLIHLAVILIILGYVGSGYLDDSKILPLRLDGEEQEFAGYTFKAVDHESTNDYVWVEVEVRRDGSLIADEKPGLILLQGQVRSEVEVVTTLKEDVYLIYGNQTTSGGGTVINLTVTVLPLMTVLWAGMYLMMAAIVIRGVTDRLIKQRRARGLPVDEVTEEDVEEGPPEDVEEEEDLGEEDEEDVDASPEEDRDDSYYEDLLEKELKRM